MEVSYTGGAAELKRCPRHKAPLGKGEEEGLPGSSVHEIFQARVLEWGAIAFSHIYSQACRNH